MAAPRPQLWLLSLAMLLLVIAHEARASSLASGSLSSSGRTLQGSSAKTSKHPQQTTTHTSTKTACYYVNWLKAVCVAGRTKADCATQRTKETEVYSSQAACCAALTKTGVWNTLATRAQGICALPEGQRTCYIPDATQRTCYAQKLDPYTGVGCSGRGLDVFATQTACCNYMVTRGFINLDKGLAGTGICSRFAQTKRCYVPSIRKATCEVASGTACDSFGVQTSFAEPTACCNSLVVTLLGIGITPQGLCKLPKNATNILKNATISHHQPSTCWVPSVAKATCVEAKGTACKSSKGKKSYTSPGACCRDLERTLKSKHLTSKGVCMTMRDAIQNAGKLA